MSLPVLSERPSAGRLARRWDPFSEMEGLYERMGQLMHSVTGELPLAAAADIEETEDAFIVDLDLPGVKRDDINVEVRENQLRVTGAVKERKRTGMLRRQSRPAGQFDYVIAVPGDVDPDQVEAMLADGVLTVRLAKSPASRPHRVEVKGS